MAKTRRTRIDDLVDEHAAELDALKDREARALLSAYEDSRRELRDRLATTPADQQFTAQRLRATLAQCEDGVARMRRRLDVAMTDSERKAGEKALRDLVALVKRAEPGFRDAGSRIEVGVLARLSEAQGLALHRYSLDRYGAQVVDAIQRELVRGVTQGQTVRELADRIAGANGSVFAGMRSRAELIARMELSRAFDVGAQASLEELAATDPPDHPDPVLKKADEYFDQRTHPFSRALHGRAVLPRQEWEVPVSAIPGGSVAGVVWQRSGAFVHGFGYPAHFNDRGRQIPWRESWGPCIRSESFRVERLKETEKRALRALGRGEQPRGLSATGQRNLELAGLTERREGRAALLPEGRRVGFEGQKKAVTGDFDYSHEPAQARRFVDVMGGGTLRANEGPSEAGPDGYWSGGGRRIPVAMTRSSQADGQTLFREIRRDVKKCERAGAAGRDVRGLVIHAECSGMSIDAVHDYLRTAPANQLPSWQTAERVILDFGGNEVLAVSASGVTRTRIP